MSTREKRTVLILDLSKSMNGRRLSRVKQLIEGAAGREDVQAKPRALKIDSIITFAEDVELITTTNTADYLKTCEANGSATKGASIPDSVNKLIEAEKEKDFTIIFATDGELDDKDAYFKSCQTLEWSAYNVNMIALVLSPEAALTCCAAIAVHCRHGISSCITIYFDKGEGQKKKEQNDFNKALDAPRSTFEVC